MLYLDNLQASYTLPGHSHLAMYACRYVRLARSEEERSHFLALAESGGVAPVAGVTDMRDVLAAGRDHQHSTLISSHRLGESEAGRRATCMDGSGTACP
jgi:hypothetical protein